SPQRGPRLERSLLDTQSHHVEGRAAHRIHRLVFESGGAVLGEAFRRVDAGHCADSGTGLVDATAARPRPHVRGGQVARGGGGIAMGSIRLEGVSKTFGRTTVIPGVDLDIAYGTFVVFVGPSGCV